MSGLKEFVTLVSNDQLAVQQVPGRASYTCDLGAPMELQDGASAWEVALVSVSMSGVPISTGSFYVLTSACAATSRLGSVRRSFLQAIPGETSALGDLEFVNEGASLVVWRPVAEGRFSEIEFAIQDDQGELVKANYASITLAFRHVSLA
eukprot:m.283801 g.283801  ORF g.283801 m.283801 type:complete len:150 (+) comp11120_c0_seq5:5624-6073(+)